MTDSKSNICLLLFDVMLDLIFVQTLDFCISSTSKLVKLLQTLI